jgi:hypothetical protein
LAEFGGRRVVDGFNGLVGGALEAPGARERAVEKARQSGSQFAGEEKSR